MLIIKFPDYYRKEDTNNLLDKKQNKLTAGTNITIDENNKISATGSLDQNKYYTKLEVDKKLEDTKSLFPTVFQSYVIAYDVPTLETKDKTIVGAINEINSKSSMYSPILPMLDNWKEVGIKINKNHIKYNFIINKRYRIYYNHESQDSNTNFSFICKEFIYGQLTTETQTLDWNKVNDRIMVSLQMSKDTIFVISDPVKYGQLLKLEELQE